MSRTPSMDIAEAEALIGPRGSTIVNSQNRALVRKWMTAQGLSAAFVVSLSLSEMQLAYDSDSHLEELKQDYRTAHIEPTPSNLGAAATPVAPQSNDGAAIAMLRDLLLNGYKPGIDESAVRTIVQEALVDAKIAPNVIEIRHDAKPPIKIEGRVHPEFEKTLRYLQGGCNVMLVGPAGCGKSHMIKQLAKALDVEHTIVGGTAGVSEGDIIGRLLPGAGGEFTYHASEFVRLYEGGNALCAFDEIDGFDPNMLMVANMPLANGSMYVHLRHDNPQVKRGERVYMMATANTYGTGANPIYCSRNAMDEATRDRFIIVTVDYDKALEEQIATAGGLTPAEMAGLWELRDRAREAQLRRVISTRAFQKAAVMKQAGDSWREIRDRLLEGWSKDEKAKVGA